MPALTTIYMITTLVMLLRLVTAQIRYRAGIRAEELREALVDYYMERDRARQEFWVRPAPPSVHRLRVVRLAEEAEQSG